MIGLEEGLRVLWEKAVGSAGHLHMMVEVMTGLEGGLCFMMEAAVGSAGHLHTVVELEGGVGWALEEATGLKGPTNMTQDFLPRRYCGM